jgi:prepilin-type N-terminal cleavage/methylation domain-containing protein
MRSMRSARPRAARASERGVTLVETLIAVAVLGIAIVVFVAGLSTGTISTSHSDRLSTAHELARSQLEYTKASTYSTAPTSYPTVTPPAGFGVTASASSITGGDAAVQLITVEVSDATGVVYTLEGYKVDR